MRKNSAFFSSKTHIRSQIRAFRLFEISFQPEYSFFLSFAQSKFAFFRHKKFLFFYFRQLRTHSANTKTQKHQKVFEGLRAAAGDGASARWLRNRGTLAATFLEYASAHMECGNSVTPVTFAALLVGGREPRLAMALPRNGVETAARWPLRF